MTGGRLSSGGHKARRLRTTGVSRPAGARPAGYAYPRDTRSRGALRPADPALRPAEWRPPRTGTFRARVREVPRRSSPRLETFTYLGRHAYSLTCCTFKRQRLFTKGEVVDGVSWQILHAARVEGFAIPAYCFMPDHLHVIAVGQEAWSDARAFMNVAKRRSAYWY